ncbi:MAG: TGS domain-containing protein, partial [Apilactobacillus kunkeei]|nr:TGS domain-containing protein [Apilactobacillus kunkeei]
MAKISFEFPDGSVKEFDQGVTTEDIAKSISISLAKKSVAGKIDGKMVEIDLPLEKGGKIEIVTKDTEDGLKVLRQTASQLLKAALADQFNNIQFGESTSDEDGFFVDTDKRDSQVSADELPQVEERINKMVSDNVKIERKVLSLEDALKQVDGDPYQAKLVNELAEDGQVVFYQIGDYLGLGEGVVLPEAKAVKEYKLLSVAGAYWEGKSSNPMLQRIFATAFYKKADLEEDLKRRQEAKERDHRVIGNKLDLFFVDPKVGAGLAYWMPNGATIRRVVERYIIDKELANGYQHVITPVLMNLDAYKTSGHWQHYREDMFPPMDMGD